MNLLRVLMLFAVFLAATASRLPRDTDGDDDDFLPSYEQPEPETCVASNGADGLCVHESYCNEEHTIMPGGVIDKSEFREMPNKPCKGQFIWCCTQDLVIETPTLRNTNTDVCLPADGDICSWAVKLYKVADLKQPEGRLFCIGTLIGSKLILTASSCLKAAEHHMLFARLPASAEPNKDYIVRHRKYHPEYNSGTHKNDFGILVLEEEVSWGKEKTRGACLAFNKLEGTCMTLGFDGDDEIASTVMTVTKDGCNNFGGVKTSDRACGTQADSDCIVAMGAPVVCESKSGGGVVVGVTRSGCFKDQVLLGSLENLTSWITHEFNAMNVTKDVYLQN